MSVNDYNRQAIRALERAQTATGIRSAAAFARRLADRTGGPPNASTFQRWIRGESAIPAWALIAAAEEAQVSLEGLFSGEAVDQDRLGHLEETIKALQAQVANLGATAATPESAEPHRGDVACAYVVQDDRVLMTQRRFRQGNLEWSPPCGNVKPGETPEQAAVREVKEEVGLIIEVTQRLGDRIHPDTGRHLIYFACRVLAGTAQVHDHEEIAQIEWCTPAGVEDKLAPLKGGLFGPVRDYFMRTIGTSQEQRA